MSFFFDDFLPSKRHYHSRKEYFKTARAEYKVVCPNGTSDYITR